MKQLKLLPALLVTTIIVMSGCVHDEPQPLVTLSESTGHDHKRSSSSGRLASDFILRSKPPLAITGHDIFPCVRDQVTKLRVI